MILVSAGRDWSTLCTVLANKDACEPRTDPADAYEFEKNGIAMTVNKRFIVRALLLSKPMTMCNCRNCVRDMKVSCHWPIGLKVGFDRTKRRESVISVNDTSRKDINREKVSLFYLGNFFWAKSNGRSP